MNIEPVHWEKLKVYWNKLEIEKKAKQMSNAKNKVKNLTNVGCTSKVGMEAELVSFYVQMYVVIIICLCNLYYFYMIIVHCIDHSFFVVEKIEAMKPKSNRNC